MNQIVELNAVETQEVSGGVSVQRLFGFAIYMATFHYVLLPSGE